MYMVKIYDRLRTQCVCVAKISKTGKKKQYPGGLSCMGFMMTYESIVKESVCLFRGKHTKTTF